MIVRSSKWLLPNQVALMLRGRVVWVGPLSAPWDDVDCDEIVVSPPDYESVRLRTLPHDAQL